MSRALRLSPPLSLSAVSLSKLLLAAITLAAVGCGSKPAADSSDTQAANSSDAQAPPVSIDDLEAAHEHSGHSHADNYPDAVAELETLNGEIAAAFAADKIADADNAVHEIPHVLESLAELAGDAGLSDAAVAEVNSAVQKLFDAFEAVDAKIHGGEGKDYDEVQAEVDAALAVLRGHVAS